MFYCLVKIPLMFKAKFDKTAIEIKTIRSLKFDLIIFIFVIINIYLIFIYAIPFDLFICFIHLILCLGLSFNI